jgi:hypothetical protein
MDGMNHEPADEDDAARAFEALREEVAALRRGVELVYRQGQQSVAAAPGAPDYSPTLGKMEQALQAIAGRLDAIEHQPALTLTPASFRAEIDTVAGVAAGTVSRPFVDAVHQVQSAARDLTALAGRVHERREQRMWVLTAGALGLLVGVGLWFVAAGLLPRSAGDRIAASLIGGSRWQAAETLMQEGSPETWTRMVRLYNACGEQATGLCEAAIAVEATQPGQEGGRAESAPTPSHPVPRGRRVGGRGQ